MVPTIERHFKGSHWPPSPVLSPQRSTSPAACWWSLSPVPGSQQTSMAEASGPAKGTSTQYSDWLTRHMEEGMHNASASAHGTYKRACTMHMVHGIGRMHIVLAVQSAEGPPPQHVHGLLLQCKGGG
eukprot:scaffold203313_cov22-Tisochrysis_lutea.AAC.2